MLEAIKDSDRQADMKLLYHPKLRLPPSANGVFDKQRIDPLVLVFKAHKPSLESLVQLAADWEERADMIDPQEVRCKVVSVVEDAGPRAVERSLLIQAAYCMQLAYEVLADKVEDIAEELVEQVQDKSVVLDRKTLQCAALKTLLGDISKRSPAELSELCQGLMEDTGPIVAAVNARIEREREIKAEWKAMLERVPVYIAEVGELKVVWNERAEELKVSTGEIEEKLRRALDGNGDIAVDEQSDRSQELAARHKVMQSGLLWRSAYLIQLIDAVMRRHIEKVASQHLSANVNDNLDFHANAACTSVLADLHGDDATRTPYTLHQACEALYRDEGSLVARLDQWVTEHLEDSVRKAADISQQLQTLRERYEDLVRINAIWKERAAQVEGTDKSQVKLTNVRSEDITDGEPGKAARDQEMRFDDWSARIKLLEQHAQDVIQSYASQIIDKLAAEALDQPALAFRQDDIEQLVFELHKSLGTAGMKKTARETHEACERILLEAQAVKDLLIKWMAENPTGVERK